MQYLAAYDIGNSKRLRKVARVMKSYGIRAQKSVFECSLDDNKIAELKEKIKSLIEKNEDSFRIYPLYNDALNQQTALGTAKINQFPTNYVL